MTLNGQNIKIGIQCYECIGHVVSLGNKNLEGARISKTKNPNGYEIIEFRPRLRGYKHYGPFLQMSSIINERKIRRTWCRVWSMPRSMEY